MPRACGCAGSLTAGSSTRGCPRTSRPASRSTRTTPWTGAIWSAASTPPGAPPAAAAKIANDDTFHFTNCTPQHHDFNAGRTLWAGLENYVLDNADNLKFRVNVFSGPVLAADDEQYRGVQLPRQFWKVVAMVKQGGGLSATAYLLSQEELIKGLEVAPEAFSYGAYRTYQVPVQQIEGLTGLSFGSLADADPLAREEAAVTARKSRARRSSASDSRTVRPAGRGPGARPASVRE